MGEFDKLKDVLYKGNKVPTEIVKILHRDDLTLDEFYWEQTLSVPSIFILYQDVDFDFTDDIQPINDFMYFLDDSGLEYTDTEYFNLNRGVSITVFRLPPNTSLIKLKFEWDLYKLKERED